MTVRPEELAATLNKRFRAEIARNSERANTLRRDLPLGLQPLLRPKQRAWLIGSLARGDWDAASDVDVVVEGLDSDQRSDIWNTLSEALVIRVDVLAFEQLDEAFQRTILREGVRLDVA